MTVILRFEDKTRAFKDDYRFTYYYTIESDTLKVWQDDGKYPPMTPYEEFTVEPRRGWTSVIDIVSETRSAVMRNRAGAAGRKPPA